MPKSELPSKLLSNKTPRWNWKNVVTPKKSVPKSKLGDWGNMKTYIPSLTRSQQSAIDGGRRKSRRKRKQRKSRKTKRGRKRRKSRRKRKR